jgi:hypothetical protein
MAKLTLADLGPGFEAKVGRYYPHMLSEDVAVWTRWLSGNPGRLQGCWYDVHVGVAVDVPNDVPEEMKRVSLAVTRKRIDVVCLSGQELWVVEVKPFAGFTALGQVVGYRRLFVAEYSVELPVVGVCVCMGVDEDLVDDFQAAGVRLEVAV